MSANLGTLGSLFVDMAVNTANFETDMGRAQRLAEKNAREMQKSFQEAGEKILAAFESYRIGEKLVESVSEAIKQFDELGKTAQKIGVGTQRLSELKYAASQSGVQFDALTGAVAKFNKATVEGASGNAQVLSAFKSLGISVDDLKRKSPDELLNLVATRFSETADNAVKTSVAMALFGKSGDQIIPFLNQGAIGIARFSKEADNFHVAVSDGAAKAADEFRTNLGRLEAAAHGVANMAAEQLLPVLQDWSDKAVTAASKTDSMDTAARSLATGMKLLASAGLFTASTFQEFGTVIGGVAAAIAKMSEGSANSNLGENLLKYGPLAFVAKTKLSDVTAGVKILQETFKDAAAQEAQYAEKFDKLWAGIDTRAKSVGEAVQPPAAKPSLNYSPNSVADAASAAADRQAAVETLQSLIAKQEQQIVVAANVSKGNKENAESTMALSLASGELAEVVKRAGAGSEVYAGKLLAQAHVLDQVKAAGERFMEQQRRAVALADQLQKQAMKSDEKSVKPFDAGAMFSTKETPEAQSKRLLADERTRYQDQLNLLKKYYNERALSDQQYQTASADAEAIHTKRMAAIDEQLYAQKITAAQASSQALGNLSDAMQRSGLEKSRAGFEIAKAINIAQAIANTATAVTNALAVPPYPVGMALAVTAGIAGAAEIAAIQAQSFPGKRYGGDVFAGGMYEVAEPGNPELLRYGSKTLLMMGSQSGTVSPAKPMPAFSGGAGGMQIVVNNHGEPLDYRIKSILGNVVTVDAMPEYLAQARSTTVSALANAGSPENRQIARVHGTQIRGRN